MTNSRSSDPTPEMVEKIGDLKWFNTVLADSKDRLASSSEGSRSSWYKEHEAEKRIAANHHAN